MSSKKSPESGPNLGKAVKQLKQLQNLAKNRTTNSAPLPMPDPVPDAHFELDWTKQILSKEEIYSDYLNFLRYLPNFLKIEKEKTIRIVKNKLKITEIEKSLDSLNFENLMNIREGATIIDQLSAQLGQSLR